MSTWASSIRDGSEPILGRGSVDFGSSRFRFGFNFTPTVFGFGDPRLIGFGFVFHPWMPNGSLEIDHFE
jgi:hypothetical protein